jgi:hypothetical protein
VWALREANRHATTDAPTTDPFDGRRPARLAVDTSVRVAPSSAMTMPETATLTRDWTTAPTTELIDTLRTCGLDVPAGLPAEIVRRRDETLAPLCALARDDAFWANADGPGAWAPIHALHLLGALGGMEAADVLLDVVRRRELGDWLADGVPELLGRFPPEAIDRFDAFARDRTLDTYQRHAAAFGLCGIASQHPDARPDVVRRLITRFDTDDDAQFLAFLVDEAARMPDPALQAAIERAFERSAIDEGIITASDVDEIRRRAAPWTTGRILTDPMEHFSAASLAQFRRGAADRTEALARAAMQRATPPVVPRPAEGGPIRRAGPKVGRNDPCPCGSGKKYKKCHGRRSVALSCPRRVGPMRVPDAEVERFYAAWVPWLAWVNAQRGTTTPGGGSQ